MKHSITIYREKKELSRLRAFVIERLRLLGVCEKDTYLIALAVEEVCANRIVHVFPAPAPHDNIEIVLTRADENVVVEIKDEGNAFDFGEYIPPSLEEIIKEKKNGGIGLLLVKKIIDKIDVAYENGIHICRLLKSFSPSL